MHARDILVHFGDRSGRAGAGVNGAILFHEGHRYPLGMGMGAVCGNRERPGIPSIWTGLAGARQAVKIQLERLGLACERLSRHRCIFPIIFTHSTLMLKALGL
jgi:hypothetical protein